MRRGSCPTTLPRRRLASDPLPFALKQTCRRLHVQPTRFVLVVNVRRQIMTLWEKGPWRSKSEFVPCRSRREKALNSKSEIRNPKSEMRRSLCTSPPTNSQYFLFPEYKLRKRYLISTSRFGTGQEGGSNKTPLGLHRVAEKIGAGWPTGTVFRARQVIGFTWRGLPSATIAHRILWLEGLEPGFNHGGNVDSHSRYIYIHGLADEPTLGRPVSHGCIHMAATDLLPLFDQIPSGSLVWIEAGF